MVMGHCRYTWMTPARPYTCVVQDTRAERAQNAACIVASSHLLVTVHIYYILLALSLILIFTIEIEFS